MKKRLDPFGILAFLHWNHDWNKYHFDQPTLAKAVSQLKELGMSFVRLDILWSDVFRHNKPNDYSRYDPIVRQLTQNGISVLALLQYNRTDPNNKTEKWNDPPASFDEFADYVSQTVRHYKNSIHFWEIWNEPNHEYYWSGPQDGLKKYSRLLSASYAAAKIADPSCTLLNGGFANPIPEAVEGLYRNGGKEIFDILNIHPFLDPLGPDPAAEFKKIITQIRRIMKSYGDSRKKIWVTEMGCPGIPEGEIFQSWFAGAGLSEHQQAEWLETQYGFLKDNLSVEKIFWAFYRDTDKMFNEATDYLGIVRKDLSPKPAFFRLKKLISQHK